MTKIVPLTCLIALALPACVPTTPPTATATERALCREITASLPTRSRSDTARTQAEVGEIRRVVAALCPAP